MTGRLTAQAVFVALLLAGTGAAASITWPAATGSDGLARISGDPAGAGPAVQQKGRYKQDGEACLWDANDSGPDQCTPRVVGRFKKSGDACVWDAKDKGPDQCQPPSGRWKTEGDRCVWDPKDSGANQCNPREPRRNRD